MIDVSYALSENPQDLAKNIKNRLPADIQIISVSSSKKKPFSYTIFHEKEKNTYYLVFDGTYFPPLKDLLMDHLRTLINPFEIIPFVMKYSSAPGDIAADLQILLEIVPRQMKQASSVLQNLIIQHPDAQIIAVGHSLGGSLAQYAMMKTSSPSTKCMTYNGLGLPPKVLLDVTEGYGDRVIHIVHDEDIVKSFYPEHLDGRIIRIDSKEIANNDSRTSNKENKGESLFSGISLNDEMDVFIKATEADVGNLSNNLEMLCTMMSSVCPIVYEGYKIAEAGGEKLAVFNHRVQQHGIQTMINSMLKTNNYEDALKRIKNSCSVSTRDGDSSYRFHVGIPRERLDNLKNMHSQKDISAYFERDERLGHEAWQIAQSGTDLMSGMFQYQKESAAIDEEREHVIKEILKNNCYDSLKLYIDLTIPSSFCDEYQKKTNTKWFEELMEIHDQMVNQLASVVDIGSAEKAVAQLEVLSEKMAMKKTSSRLGLGTTMSLEIQIRKFANQIIQAGLERFDRQKTRIMESSYYGSTKLKELLRTGGVLNRISLFANDYLQRD